MSATCFRSRTQLWTRSYKGMILSACGTTQRRPDNDWVQHFHTMVTKWEHEKAKWKRASHVDCHGTTHAYRQRHTRGLGPLWQYDHVENTMFKSNRSLPRAKVEWWALTPVPCNPWTESQKETDSPCGMFYPHFCYFIWWSRYVHRRAWARVNNY